MVNAGRSVGDEPMAVSQLVRIACRGRAAAALERVLAQTEPPAGALAELQTLLEDESRRELLLIILRGERGGGNRTVEALEDGIAAAGSGTDLLDGILTRMSRDEIKRQHSEYLRWMNQAVEAARLPSHRRQETLSQLSAMVKDEGELVGLLAVDLEKLNQADQRGLAQNRCAATALAAERFRVHRGAWPRSLVEIVESGLPPEVAIDPFNGEPLRLAKVEDGLITYAVGPDLTDDGGRLNRQNPTAAGSDIGFRLWNPAARRQPPLLAEKADQPPDVKHGAP